MKFLLPLILLIIGVGVGVGAGVMLEPASEQAELSEQNAEPGTNSHPDDVTENHQTPNEADARYVALNNQFVIPIIARDRVDALVVLSLGIEVDSAQTENVYQREPKLRDEMLQVLFNHANLGGFAGQFTDSKNMDALRRALLEAAQSVLGPAAYGVVIIEIARQDM